jgi:hypothetical protein
MHRLVFDFTTVETAGDYVSTGFAGISLFAAGREEIFIGNASGMIPWWSLVEQPGAIVHPLDVLGEPAEFRFTYDYESGAYALWWRSGPTLLLAGTTDPELPIDEVRVANGGGGDIAIERISAEELFLTPEPGPAAAWTALGALGLLAVRRLSPGQPRPRP